MRVTVAFPGATPATCFPQDDLVRRTLSEMPRPALEAWTSRGREEPTVGVMHVSKSEIPNDRSAIERGFAVAVQRGEPPVGWGAWHHHGNHHVVAYVLAGTVHVDAGGSGNGSSRPRPATSSTSNLRQFIESGTARESSRRSASTSAPGPDA